jgi:hypothetical protein
MVNSEGEDEAFRPWEQAGAVRRDCEPHSGPWLRAMGCVSLMICTSSLALAAPYLGMPGGGLVWVAGPGLLFLAAGLGLGFSIVALARRDLAGMRAGRMDRAGEQATRTAWACGLAGVATGLLAILAWGVVLWQLLR